MLKSYKSTYTWRGQVYDVSYQFDICIRSKADFCLVYYRYKLDIDMNVFFFVLEKMTFGSYLATISALVLLSWPLVKMTWNPIGYKKKLYMDFLATS
jgi:hypothetical protein